MYWGKGGGRESCCDPPTNYRSQLWTGPAALSLGRRTRITAQHGTCIQGLMDDRVTEVCACCTARCDARSHGLRHPCDQHRGGNVRYGPWPIRETRIGARRDESGLWRTRVGCRGCALGTRGAQQMRYLERKAALRRSEGVAVLRPVAMGLCRQQ